MKSITRDCDEEEARAISRQLGKRTEGADYLAERQAAEEWLRSRLPLGVQVTCSSPLYYRLTPTHMTNKHADHFWMNVWGTSIPADRMTFTLDDSMRLFAREGRRPWLSGITTPVDAAAKLHTAEEIRDWIEQYGFPYPLDDPEQYIEAQVWDEAPTIMYL